MIRKLTLRNFKRFKEVTFEFPGHVVLAGPNNTGKTTALQAVAAWAFALDRWKRLNDFHRHGGAYTRVPITRQAFSAVPLRTFDLLWRDRNYLPRDPIEIEVFSDSGWSLAMQFVADSTEQIYVRPRSDREPADVRRITLEAVFVPPMTGLSTDEPVYQKPKVDQLLGLAQPGQVLRNLLVEASHSTASWDALCGAIRRLFAFELLPPDDSGAHIITEYQRVGSQVKLDIASAGSGFQQVLMLLTFLHTRPASVLLLDEPDAHLHVILQDAIFGELRAVASEKKSQLIVATHSEVIIDSVEPQHLLVMLDQPRLVADTDEKRLLIESLAVLSHEDIVLALQTPGVLYLEDYTDLAILREWARVLEHPTHALLTQRLFWKRTVAQPRPGAEGIKSRDHYDALKLVRADLPGLELLDGDARPNPPDTAITGQGLQRMRWKRYEIESYLVHPTALHRFVESQVGPAQAAATRPSLEAHLVATFRQQFVDAPLAPEPLVENYLRTTKARTDILPQILTAAGLPGFEYTRYSEIARVMLPDEVHPEVREKLDGLQQAFRL